MGHFGGTTINEFEGICFKHNTYIPGILGLVLFRANRFSVYAVEAFRKENFIRGKITQAMVSKDQAVVHAANVSDEEVVVRESLFKIDGPNLFTDGHHHQTQGG